MSGHSKWSTIKRKKGAADAKRGKIFTRCIHEITVAAREQGGDPSGNPRLRLAIDKARSYNMPQDNIDRAIKRATGELKGSITEEITYEGYGPSRTAVLVEALTDNRNRTASEVRFAFSRAGGSLGESGCVSWMFKKTGVILIPALGLNEDEVIEKSLESGADDCEIDGEYFSITTDISNFSSTREELAKKFKIESAEIQQVPNSYVDVSKEESEKVIRLLELLDDLDDVVQVSSNCNFIE